MTEPTPLQRFWASCFAPIDVAWLVALRVLFGLVMCASMARFVHYGWVDEFFVKPDFHFKYWGFQWVQPLPAPLMHGLFWLLAALALCIAAGFAFRFAAFGFFLGFSYVQLIDVTTYLNHYYLASLLSLLLALSPAGKAFSIDALIDRRSIETIAGGWHHLFRFQVGIVYTFAGIAKATSDWLLHAQPLQIWLGSRTDLPVLGVLFTHDWAAPLMSWAGFLYDISIAWWLLFSRTRPFAFVAVIVFHTLTRLLFPIGIFPYIMVLGALAFFSPSWPRKLLRRPLPDLSRALPLAKSRGARLAIGVALAFCAFQLVMPLRFVAYGGNVLWHEQGMRFSWRVMVREKNGSITYLVRQKASGRTWHVAPRKYLTWIQAREMSGQPDLILQLAHHIRDDFDARGLGPVEVRADARVSLNGRRGAPLIDPDVDLTTIEDGIARAEWILPSPDGPPPELIPLARR